ncbi:MAG: multicopper oxidase domain-containing protein [Gemmatimonadales bacterium]
MSSRRRLGISHAFLLLLLGCARTNAPLPLVVTHDNNARAGRLVGDTLRLTLVTRQGLWRAGAAGDTAVAVWTLTQPDSAPVIPAPLVRVQVGTVLRVTLRNSHPDSTLQVHGLSNRPGAADSAIAVPPGEERSMTFAAGPAGTYYYWAALSHAKLVDRSAEESQLAGAFIVDSTSTPPADKIYILGIWNSPIDSSLGAPYVDRFVATINGRSYPATTPLDVEQGDTVRWRWINPTADSHPIHLHGFFFDVDHLGNAQVDSLEPSRSVVTELMLPGATFSGEWIASEPGNWVAHCHFAFHTSHYVDFKRIPDPDDPGGPAEALQGHHAMRGMVIPITVRQRPGQPTRADLGVGTPRAIQLEARAAPAIYGKAEGVAFVASDERAAPIPFPTISSTLVLRRGEPVRISIINTTRARTSVHWHGIELPSYPDGIPNWSGIGDQRAPAIEPGDTFVAAFTPPRAGTFIYHAHSNEGFQISSGMYGALLVVDPANYHPDHERLIVVGGDGADLKQGRVNGQLLPDTITITAGEPYRFRFIQINVDWRVHLVLRNGGQIQPWTPVAKDGADLAGPLRRAEPGDWQAGPGETRDVMIEAPKPGLWQLEAKTSQRGWSVSVPIRVVPKTRKR